ncbi:negative regulator of AmpC, AmpD [Salinisphaera dokdonensis CL-ES53]|uniref:N-acetylmuramoyl-L-alanine amidase n=1 Tax=Salinisphaera dokdonensis CL-ES53 TaxID=1304272 RepID=A0ABV2B3X0_9GAMM
MRTTRLALLVGIAWAITACTPATLKQRNGYWADQAQSARAYNQRVRFLVMHYTGGDEPRALKVLTGNSVSSHYLVGDRPPEHSGDPVVYQLVDEYARAWHAGTSAWADRSHLNDSSIGIEIVNAGPIETAGGPAWQGFGGGQIEAVTTLARDIIRRYDIQPVNVVGHSDIAPGRKVDPGPAFPWEELYRRGIGAWPDAATVDAYRRRFFQRMPDIAAIQSALSRYGYQIPVTGVLDQRTHSVLVSFQMHFRPARYDGTPDVDTVARLWALNDKYR